MSQSYERLKAKLMELFQLDQPDLDFGFYRIMHAKSAEVTRFLDVELLPQVRDAFAQYQTASKADLEKELARALEQAKGLGADPDALPKVVELRRRLAEEAVDLEGLEAEVYDHLYSFFRRYYSDGDFLSRRVYKPGVYAIPYEGEEVKLHWANADQYYIKTSEYLRDYAFRLRPENEANPIRVHFRLVDAEEGEHGNVKEAAGKERRFKLAEDPPVRLEDGELVVRFTYQPDPAKQRDLNAAAETAILATSDASLMEWLRVLGAKHVRSDGTESDATRLRVHVDRYTGRNTFDYFIHKDLGGFLRRELDFYIKNEVMHLDDVESETAPRVEQYLSKIRVIRRIAGKVVDFLAQLEDFQKKLWLKKKFVVETSYCIRLGVIPEEFYPEIAANEAQREEWVRLCAIDEVVGDLVKPGYSEPLTVEFLKACPSLMVDTRHFGGELTERLLASIAHLDAQGDGVLFHSENLQALEMMQSRYREQVKCVYIDPPYNTGKDGFPYKDAYRSASWLSMMQERVSSCLPLLRNDAAFLCSIDDNEFRQLHWLMDAAFGATNRVGTVVWRNARDNNPTRIAIEHEYVQCHVRDISAADSVWKNDFADSKELLLGEYERLIEQGAGRQATQAALRNFIKDNASLLGEVDRYKFVDDNGVYTGSQSVHNPHPGGYEYEILHPRSGKPMRMPANGYRFPETTMRRDFIEKDRLIYGPDENRIVQIKLYLNDFKDSFRSVLDLDGRLGAYALQSQFGRTDASFDNPKPPQLLRRLLSFASAPESTVLDYFAGSGTTAQSVTEIVRATGVPMRFILVEMGDHFDTVLLPRLKKVTYTPEWKDGKPKRLATPEEAERSPRIMKVIRLESYEDTLNNLELRRTEEQQGLLDLAPAQGADGLREQYVLRYMLDVETRGSQSLLNVDAFTDPTAYRLKVKRPGSDETREVNVDLLETFNWLIGLTVQHIAAPRRFAASFSRDDDADLPKDAPRRLLLDGRLREDTDGRWWFRTVTGTTPDGRRALVIWRNRPGEDAPEGVEEDNLVLEEWFKKQGYSSKDSEFDVIWVNGGNNLENLKAPDDTWKVRLIEEDFHRLMFDMERV
ncbi:MAG TPA: site-specific DNA-methyltransferase [Longimicrobiales bacterium]|nr:site-specific DNA-methyltransferase [Longimicrobiales bacterium]